MSQPAFDQRGRHGKFNLPQNWRAIEGRPDELLYVIRVCYGYWCRLECGEWHAYHDPSGWAPMAGAIIGKGALMDHALIACREHLHANAKEAV